MTFNRMRERERERERERLVKCFVLFSLIRFQLMLSTVRIPKIMCKAKEREGDTKDVGQSERERDRDTVVKYFCFHIEFDCHIYLIVTTEEN